jgi:hypothetical protein
MTSQQTRLPRRASGALKVAAACLALWVVIFAKVGVGLVFGAHDYVVRVRTFPHLQIAGDAGADYKNWSVLPLAIGRAVGADSVRSFAALQAALLVTGTAGIIGAVACRRPEAASRAVLGFFATMLPGWLLVSGGSYDQLLAVVLLAATLVEQPKLAIVIGVLLGLTHAEAATVAVLGLALLSSAQIGPRLPARLWLLGGIALARGTLTLWFHAAGQTGDRAGFVSDLGITTPLGYLANTWPIVIWSAAAGGWLVLASSMSGTRDRRARVLVVTALATNLAVTAITVDQSRVMMLTTMPLVVALAAFEDTASSKHAPPLRQALLVGLLAPITISWVGDVAIAGAPFHVNW